MVCRIQGALVRGSSRHPVRGAPVAQPWHDTIRWAWYASEARSLWGWDKYSHGIHCTRRLLFIDQGTRDGAACCLAVTDCSVTDSVGASPIPGKSGFLARAKFNGIDAVHTAEVPPRCHRLLLSISKASIVPYGRRKLGSTLGRLHYELPKLKACPAGGRHRAGPVGQACKVSLSQSLTDNASTP